MPFAVVNALAASVAALPALTACSFTRYTHYRTITLDLPRFPALHLPLPARYAHRWSRTLLPPLYRRFPAFVFAFFPL
ncbi:hypothetical protein [Neisseria subflava]|uniref:hypothetical protein n=1 Tax=Neisseria subflava TaxID=28449 RepID=UPI002029F212|nr:hypothetical protein [Neisseria subflava]MCL9764993.1 hypothetical protein [Neisseria subflava]